MIRHFLDLGFKIRLNIKKKSTFQIELEKVDTLYPVTFILTLMENTPAACCLEQNTGEVWLSRNRMYTKHICNPVKTQLSREFKNTLRITVFPCGFHSRKGDQSTVV